MKDGTLLPDGYSLLWQRVTLFSLFVSKDRHLENVVALSFHFSLLGDVKIIDDPREISLA